MNAPDPAMRRLLEALDEQARVDAQEPTPEELAGFRAAAAAVLAGHRSQSGPAVTDEALERVIASWRCELGVVLTRGASSVHLEIRGEDVLDVLLGRPRRPVDPWPLLLLDVFEGRLEVELGRVPPVSNRVEVHLHGAIDTVVRLSPDAHGVLVGSAQVPGLDAQTLADYVATVVVLDERHHD